MLRTKLSIFLFVLFTLFTACKDDNPVAPAPAPTPTTGTVSGTVTLPAGASGTVANARVSIYASYEDWRADRVLKVAAAASNGAFTISDVAPGSYYLDVWKDIDNTVSISSGDVYGVYGSGSYPNYTVSPFSVSAGNTTSINVQLNIIP
jgi:uncharacterized protein (DUF2141 family)